MPLAQKPEPVSANPEMSIDDAAAGAGGAEAVGGPGGAGLGRLRGAVDEELEVVALAQLAVVAELRLDPRQLDRRVRPVAQSLEETDARWTVGRPAGVVYVSCGRKSVYR